MERNACAHDLRIIYFYIAVHNVRWRDRFAIAVLVFIVLIGN